MRASCKQAISPKQRITVIKIFKTLEKDKEINLLFKQIENLNDQLADQSDENAQLESDLESARSQLDEKIKEISDLMKIIEGRV